MFWGAVVVLSLIVLVGFGIRPVRSMMAQSMRKHRAAKQARYREQTSQTAEGANSVAMSLNMKGNALDRKREFAAALQCYREALEVARKFQLKPRAQASMEMMGNAFDEMGMADSAAIYYQKSREIAEVDTTQGRVMRNLFNRGVSLIRNRETNDNGVAMLRQALEQAQAAGDSQLVLQITYNLGIGYLYGFKPDSCVTYLRRYVELCRGNLDTKWDAIVHFNTGLAFGQKREWDSAYVHFAKALDDDYILRNKTDIWLLQQDMDSARGWGGIPETPADHKVPRIPRPKGVNLDWDLYLMSRGPPPWEL